MARVKLDRQILPMVVAHRGASARVAENTLAAFEAAVEAGADMVELDVRLSAEGIPVIRHDADVDGRFVHACSVAELKAMDVSGSSDGPRGEIPTLAEALGLLSGRIAVDLEIKNLPGEPAFDSPREAIAEAIVRTLDEVSFTGPVLASSFNWLSIERVRELQPEVATGFLTHAMIDPRAALVYARQAGHEYVLPQAPALFEDPGFPAAAHAEGVGVGAWTVDDPEAIGRLFAMGVDAVATNDPAAAIAIRDRYRASAQ
jgi:glycerophosphoryl diester phosphodiesterase